MVDAAARRRLLRRRRRTTSRQAVIYGVDNGALVIQEALGTLNNTQLARQAVEYAYDHGVAVIASAADEAAQHHNWPSNYPHTIVVNSVTAVRHTFTPNRLVPPVQRLHELLDQDHASRSRARAARRTRPASARAWPGSSTAPRSTRSTTATSTRTRPASSSSGDPCPLSVNEVRQLMASGTDRRHARRPTTSTSRPSRSRPARRCRRPAAPTRTACSPTRTPTARRRRRWRPRSATRRARASTSTTATAARTWSRRPIAIGAGTIPPEAEITSPEWYAQVDPTQPTVDVRGEVYARGGTYTCRVEVAPGSEPNNGRTTDIPPGDFKHGLVRAGATARTTRAPFDGVLATLDLDRRSRRASRRRPGASTAPSRRPARRTSTAGRTTSRTASSCGWSSTQRPGRRRR